MDQLPLTITATIAVLTVFLATLTALKYAVRSNFVRTRAIMTLFFCFIVATLTLSFWPYALATLPYSIPSFVVGAALGHLIGVRAAQKKLSVQGAEHYMEHFAHIHFHEVRKLMWWSVINFYSVMSALILINFVGFSTVLQQGSLLWAEITSSVGAFLLGTIAPYLVHLWTLSARTHASDK